MDASMLDLSGGLGGLETNTNLARTERRLSASKGSTLALERAESMEGGHFEPIEGSQVRIWVNEPRMRVSPVSRNGQPARKLTTTDFGVMEKVRYYDSIHYRNRLRWFQPLVPRQFYVNDVYYHQMRQRLPAWDELFLDLVYVAAFLQVGEILKETPITGASFNHFCLVTIPIWISWFIMDQMNNMFGSASFTYKIFSWLYHIFVIGMASTAVNVFPHSDNATSTYRMFVLNYFLSQLLAFMYGLTLYMSMPKVATSFTLVTFASLLTTVPALCSIAFPEQLSNLWWISWALQLFALKSVTIINHFAIKSPYGVLVDAGHQAERNNLFTVVVLGEVFSAIIWSSTEGGFDITDLFTIFGAIIALCFQFLYFTVDQENMLEKEDVSVPRRISWQMLHLLFHLSIITTGASISNLIGRSNPDKIKFDTTKYPVPIGDEPLDAPLRIAFTSAVSVTLFCLSAFVMLMGRVPVFRTYIPFAAVLGFRLATALTILLVGLVATTLTAFHVISFVTGLLVLNMAVSVAGLQNKGDVTLRDTACHYRLGLR